MVGKVEEGGRRAGVWVFYPLKGPEAPDSLAPLRTGRPDVLRAQSGRAGGGDDDGGEGGAEGGIGDLRRWGTRWGRRRGGGRGRRSSWM